MPDRRAPRPTRRELLAAAGGSAIAAALPAAAGAAPAGAAPPGAVPPGRRNRWVAGWGAMPQLTEPGNMPPAAFIRDGVVLPDTTLRQTLRVTAGGGPVRLRFSNAFGGADLPLSAVHIALPTGGKAGVAAIQEGTSRPVTFRGRPATVVPMGAQVVSDPIAMDVTPGSIVTVTLYLAEGQASTSITSHPGSRTTSYLLAGAHVDDADLPGATPVDHWYFLSGLEVLPPAPVRALVLLGDSLTDGRGSTTNGNNRWPDQLFDRLQALPRLRDVALVNEAAGGNRVLRDGLGPNALARLDRDVLAQSGAAWLIVFEGVNDIGTAPATTADQQRITDELLFAYDQIVLRCHAQDLVVCGATLLPFGGNEGYDDAGGLREQSRRTVNDWIRGSGVFDVVADFDAAVRDPRDPRRLLAEYDTGDHLHLNPAGYRALADAVPLRLFATLP
ncbi:SGNH/GDSL hydrolase family protein [Nucisporomicrobium flavum]|uniref:SGNH/GDSL hydrolase family protein n=1 Tax=Nucisporomicrobium flavum TaxID=2785915 RepID=UPI003C2F1992